MGMWNAQEEAREGTRVVDNRGERCGVQREKAGQESEGG